MSICIDRELQDAVEALETIKQARPDYGKFKDLPFMRKELFVEFHQALTRFKETGVTNAQDLAYFKFWIKYFDLSRDELRGIVFPKSPNYERTGV